MTGRVDELPELPRGGSVVPLSTTPVVGTPSRRYELTFVPGAEPLAAGKIRVTILGSGDPWIRRSQASGSLLVEVGNAEFDELGVNDQGPVTISQDFTVFNVTEEAVVARQAKVNDAAPPVHGPSKSSPAPEPMPAPPAWWADALLDL